MSDGIPACGPAREVAQHQAAMRAKASQSLILIEWVPRLCVQDVTFHQAVNLGRYEQEKVVSFVPPDGEFELMKYRCQDGIQSPFSVLPVIAEHGRTRVEVRFMRHHQLVQRHPGQGCPPVPIKSYEGACSTAVQIAAQRRWVSRQRHGPVCFCTALQLMRLRPLSCRSLCASAAPSAPSSRR